MRNSAAISRSSAMRRAVPPIHIIVKNGRVTLKGVVASESDKRLAYVQARGAAGVFEVTNQLQVEKQ